MGQPDRLRDKKGYISTSRRTRGGVRSARHDSVWPGKTRSGIRSPTNPSLEPTSCRRFVRSPGSVHLWIGCSTGAASYRYSTERTIQRHTPLYLGISMRPSGEQRSRHSDRRVDSCRRKIDADDVRDRWRNQPDRSAERSNNRRTRPDGTCSHFERRHRRDNRQNEPPSRIASQRCSRSWRQSTCEVRIQRARRGRNGEFARYEAHTDRLGLLTSGLTSRVPLREPLIPARLPHNNPDIETIE